MIPNGCAGIGIHGRATVRRVPTRRQELPLTPDERSAGEQWRERVARARRALEAAVGNRNRFALDMHRRYAPHGHTPTHPARLPKGYPLTEGEAAYGAELDRRVSATRAELGALIAERNTWLTGMAERYAAQYHRLPSQLGALVGVSRYAYHKIVKSEEATS